MDAKFIEERRDFLSLFCKKLSHLKHLWYSDEFDVFIRSSNPDTEKVPYFIKNQKALNNLPKL